MNIDFVNAVLVQTIASLVGVFCGALAALAIDRHNNRQRHRRRARTLLRNLTQELTENNEALKVVRPAYETTPWGKSFYISTIAWETALASGDLPDILGYELADRLARQYGWLARIRYHVDLLTRLWLAPPDIAGYEEIRRGFRQAILAAMDKAMAGHVEVMQYASSQPLLR
jgi:seryl-tRNA(Sec) selenium transferase